MDKEIEFQDTTDTIQNLKNNKAPGPDNVITELFKWLGDDNIEMLRKLINECWTSCTIPEMFTFATVASIFNK